MHEDGRARDLRVELGHELVRRGLELRNGDLGAFEGDPARHRHGRVEDVPGDLGEELLADPTGEHERRGQDEHADSGSERRVAVVDRTLEDVRVMPSGESVQTRRPVSLESLPDRRPAASARGGSVTAPMREMRGEDQQRLDQREGETDDRRRAHSAEEPAHAAFEEDDGREGRDAREHTEDHGDEHVLGALDRRFDLVESLALPGVDTLSHDDGVIDKDAQYDDESDDGQSRDREVEEGKHEQRAREGDRHACRDPHGEAEAQEEREHDEDEQHARSPVAHQHVEPNDQLEGVVVEDRDGDALRQARSKRTDPVFDRRGRDQDVLFTDQLDLDHDARLAVEMAAELRVLESVDHRCDLAEAYEGPVGSGQDHDALEVGGLVGLSLGAEEDLASPCLDGPAG